MEAKIVTNNRPRNLVYGYELSEKERADFDYIEEEDFDSHDFFRYRGRIFDLSEAERTSVNGWDGQYVDSFYSAILIKLVDDDQVICGLYLA